jgi:hypothetical protein
LTLTGWLGPHHGWKWRGTGPRGTMILQRRGTMTTNGAGAGQSPCRQSKPIDPWRHHKVPPARPSAGALPLLPSISHCLGDLKEPKGGQGLCQSKGWTSRPPADTRDVRGSGYASAWPAKIAARISIPPCGWTRLDRTDSSLELPRKMLGVGGGRNTHSSQAHMSLPPRRARCGLGGADHRVPPASDPWARCCPVPRVHSETDKWAENSSVSPYAPFYPFLCFILNVFYKF